MEEEVPPLLSMMSKFVKELSDMEKRVMAHMDGRYKNYVTTSVMQQKSTTILLEKLSDVEDRLKHVEGFIDKLVGVTEDEPLRTFLKSGDYLCEIGRLDERIYEVNLRIEKALRRCDRNARNVESLQTWLKRKHG